MNLQQQSTGARPRGLRLADALAADKPHGDRVRYLAGCRCADCRSANTAYERQRALARARGEWNGLVSAERVREHMKALSQAGVGRRVVSDVAGIAETTLSLLVSGKRTKLRAMHERAILAVTPAALADRALIDAGPTWRLLDELLGWGYSKTELARELGSKAKVPALQLMRTQVTVRNAYDVERMHQRLKRVPAAAMQKHLAELSEEFYHRDRVSRMLNEAAAARGLPDVDLQVRNGTVLASSDEAVRLLHHKLTEPEA